MPTELVDGVHDITCREETGKRYRVFLATGDAPTLLDAGVADTAAAVFDGVAEVGTEPERLSLTHGDGDHAGGFDAMVDRYGVETWVPEQTTLDGEHPPDTGTATATGSAGSRPSTCPGTHRTTTP